MTTAYITAFLVYKHIQIVQPCPEYDKENYLFLITITMLVDHLI